MTDVAPQPIPAGWYQDPGNPAQQRWWDGTQWSSQVSGQAYATTTAAVVPPAPAGTSWNTPWIWVVLFAPLLSYATLFLWDFGPYVTAMLYQPTNPTAWMQALFTPQLLVATLLPFVLSAVLVVSCYLDWRELTRRGVPKPFHWAFGFLGIVYPIGRAVITNRRGMGGMVVLWVAIGVMVAGLVVSTIWSLVFFNQMLSVMLQYPGLR
jgi:uncharacterized protein DUF2510